MGGTRQGMVAHSKDRCVGIVRDLYDGHHRILSAGRIGPARERISGSERQNDRDAFIYVPGYVWNLELLAVFAWGVCRAVLDGLRGYRFERAFAGGRAGDFRDQKIRKPGGTRAHGADGLRASANSVYE